MLCSVVIRFGHGKTDLQTAGGLWASFLDFLLAHFSLVLCYSFLHKVDVDDDMLVHSYAAA